MDCQDIAQELNAYLDRELTDDESKEVQSHLDECPPCQQCFEFQAELKRLVRKECAYDGAPDRLRQWVHQLLSSELPPTES